MTGFGNNTKAKATPESSFAQALLESRNRLKRPDRRPRNRLLGLIDIQQGQDAVVATYRRSRLPLDDWRAAEPHTLFRVGDNFIHGRLKEDDLSIRIALDREDLLEYRLEGDVLDRRLEQGVEIVLDERSRIDRWVSFLRRVEREDMVAPICNVAPLEPPYLTSTLDEDLNSSQSAAILRGLGNPLTIIWGSPKTGRPRVLATLAVQFAAQGERILLTSDRPSGLDPVARQIARLLSETGLRLSLLRVGPESSAPLPNGCDQIVIGTLDDMLANNHGAESFDRVILDESERIPFPGALMAREFARRSLILCGDPQAAPDDLGAISVFEHLDVRAPDDPRVAHLDRFEPCAAPGLRRLVSELFYDSRLESLPSDLSNETTPWIAASDIEDEGESLDETLGRAFALARELGAAPEKSLILCPNADRANRIEEALHAIAPSGWPLPILSESPSGELSAETVLFDLDGETNALSLQTALLIAERRLILVGLSATKREQLEARDARWRRVFQRVDEAAPIPTP